MTARASWIGKELPPIRRGGKEYFLLGHQDCLYLVLNRCPHRGGPLKYGFINDCEEIVCPIHHNTVSISWLLRQPTTLAMVEQAFLT